MKYEQPPPKSRHELEEALHSSDGETVRDGLISAFYSEDTEWLAERCLQLIDHPAWNARYGAAIVLGNLSVKRPSNVDLARCLEAVEKLSKDERKEVRTAAQNATEDVLRALKLRRASQS